MGVNEAIEKYLEAQNRPYSANDIAQNLHKEFGKTAVQKALDYLVSKGKIVVKTYGKQKVYAIAREGTFDRAAFQARQEQLKAQQAEQEEAIAVGEGALKALEAELKSLKSSVTNEEALREQNTLKTELEKLEGRNELLSKNVRLVTEEEKKKILASKEKYEKEWRKRRRMANELLDAISENYPGSKKALYEEIGIETDEDCGVTMPPMR